MTLSTKGYNIVNFHPSDRQDDRAGIRSNPDNCTQLTFSKKQTFTLGLSVVAYLVL